MKKLPSGISDYEKLIVNNYYYIDKTEYIEKLENYPNPNVIFLRPRKFGKTLFTSMLENYYDIKTADKFEKLFSETYIGKNPTALKNRYHILKFNFSGIDTSNIDSTISGFKREVSSSINSFVQKYDLDFYVNMSENAEDIFDNLFKAFNLQKSGEKIYVIIDEYDHFANELLGFNINGFKDLVSKNGKVRKWYEILKKGTETVVDRIFITGVTPITLDAFTSGFNISADITRDFRFNEMMGFTEAELIQMMKEQDISNDEQEKLLPIMKKNYDGYLFTSEGKEKIYNSNMTLYFLNEYIARQEVPRSMVDVNIASDYEKIGRMLNLCNGEKKIDLLSKIISGEGIVTDITQKFNPAMPFGDKEMLSMLYYLGYLTVYESELGSDKLVIPNFMMKTIYSEYFLKIINEELDFTENVDYKMMEREIAYEGKIDKVIELLKYYMNNLSNRDFQGFRENNVKFMFYILAMNFRNAFMIKSEPEIHRKYPDIILLSKDSRYHSVMIEFKYLKRSEEHLVKQKQDEAKEQIIEYSSYEEIKRIENLVKYTVVAVVDDIFVEKIEC